MVSAPTTRRTQAERRAATEAKLIEATISSIVERGYAQTTVKEICQRSGVSHGGLFGRFNSLFELMLAAADEVGRRQIDMFNTVLARLQDPDSIGTVIGLLRVGARAPINVVWTELMVAARTDAELREQLRAVRDRYDAHVVDAAARLAALQGLPPEAVNTIGTIVLQYLDGDALAALPYPRPDRDPALLEAFVTMVQGYVDSVRAREQARPTT